MRISAAGFIPLHRQLLPKIILFLSWAGIVILWMLSGDPLRPFFLVYAVLIALGLAVYFALPRKRRRTGHILVMAFIGSLLLGITVLSGRGNMQIEGLFMGLLTGAMQPVILHYALAKIIGPLIFGRVWCGWACWYGMVFDLLPYKRSCGWLRGRWGMLRYVHFGISLLLVLFVWFVLRDPSGASGTPALLWFVAGALLYYGIGIGLAVALRDNRAFCKYLCPIAVPLKETSRVSLLKVAGDAAKCDSCQACVVACPMGIQIPDYIQRGERVLSTECTLCQTCLNACPHEALTLSFGVDFSRRDRLKLQRSK